MLYFAIQPTGSIDTHTAELFFPLLHLGVLCLVGRQQWTLWITLLQIQGDLRGVADDLLAILEDRQGDDIGQALALQSVQTWKKIIHLKIEALMVQMPAGFFAVVGNRELIKRAHGGPSTMMRRVYGLFGRLPSRNQQSRLSLGEPLPRPPLTWANCLGRALQLDLAGGT